MTGIEPATTGITIRCSTTELHPPESGPFPAGKRSAPLAQSAPLLQGLLHSTAIAYGKIAAESVLGRPNGLEEAMAAQESSRRSVLMEDASWGEDEAPG